MCYRRGINICKGMPAWRCSDLVSEMLQEMRHGVEAGGKGT